ncbi:CHAT domain-containing protein [Blastomonas sp.]|uniref:CHAT domain-containing protein n=1 Tax=Blastomonas sp. TaxID=1909299 RepID=UPI00359382F8
MRTAIEKRIGSLTALAGIALGLWVPSVAAQTTPLALRDSFPLGDSRGSLCQVQTRGLDVANKDIFDRSWAIVCRDSALPVGYVFALRQSGDDIDQRLEARRSTLVDCSTAQPAPAIAEGATQRNCAWRDGGLSYSVARINRGNTAFVAEGFAAYDSALSLALRSIMAGKIVPGTVEIATTSIEDPAAFARVQALTLEPDEALAEGYRRNNSGDYAQAAEFFETLQQRFIDPAATQLKQEEFLVNRALQRSNLGQFDEADALFAQARAIGSEDPVQQRLQRNFEGIHLLNQRRLDDAMARLARPVGQMATSAIALREDARITDQISTRINSGDRLSGRLGFVDDLQLTVEERAFIIDAQAGQLAATALRLKGDMQAARAGLVQALQQVISVRDGRVVSIIRLRAQIMAELSLVEEQAGNPSEARGWLTDSLALLETQYPETNAVNAVRARLAALLLRQGEEAQASALYRQVVTSALGERGVLVGFGNQLAPYFDLLARNMASQPALAADFFDATQVLARPGVAETTAILARELSAGQGEASRQFRQSLNLSRAIERARIQIAVIERGQDAAGSATLLATLRTELAEIEAAQQAALVQLAAYPQYRAASPAVLSLAELQASLQPGEAYVKLAEIAGRMFVFHADRQSATGYAATISAPRLAQQVDAIRASISEFNGTLYETSTYDVEAARAIYRDLLGPVAAQIEQSAHLIFEPDGAMLRLPPNLLITRDEPVAAFLARLENPDADAFDMTGMAWLGRSVEISTAVSARAFVDTRSAPPSRAPNAYLGMGQNTPVFNLTGFDMATRRSTDTADPACDWSLSEWNRPINAEELRRVSALLGDARSQVVTDDAFADDQIMGRGDLDQYRILHFATHGLVTPPRTSCPARPALLTSFGGETSDGLLSFRDIFDLKLDADVVILSACDTASRASVQVTRETGLQTGGGSALDGLVRSFIGAGGRVVLASHWPAPDDYDATQRLITGLFTADKGSGIASALLSAQRVLMDDALTSHPFYWAGFAVIGDGKRDIISTDTVAAAGSRGEPNMLAGGQR